MNNIVKNVFTVDVEDYFHVEAFKKVIDSKDWDNYESRVVGNTSQILELLSINDVKATFFVLGWVAKRYPDLIKKIASAGHEVASHGMSHKTIYTQDPNEFYSETKDSKSLLEDLAQKPVLGYRAATYSITNRSLWALDILVELGFKYDSSIFPIKHDNYGIYNINMEPHIIKVNTGEIVEYPISVFELGKLRIPVAGGGYFRLWPYKFSKYALKRINKKKEFVFYIHPWEIDLNQPVINAASALSKFRHYNNINKCESRLGSLFGDFSFGTMETALRNRGFVI